MKPGDMVTVNSTEVGSVRVILSRVPGSARPDDNNPMFNLDAKNMLGLVLATTEDGIGGEPEALVLFGERFGWNRTRYFQVML
jgi:hypothetical protein